MQQADWISTHLFYYDHLSTLLTECVKPVVDACRTRELIASSFFVRYWEGGPHIRLRLLPATTGRTEEIQATVEEAARRFFAAHPSTTQLDTQQYEKATGTLTQLLYGEGRQMPLQHADSVQYVPYQPEHELYGGVRAMPHIETLFMHSSDIALEALTAATSAQHLTGQALSIILLTLTQHEPDLHRLAPDVTSHLRSWHRMPAELRTRLYSQFARQYEKQRSRLVPFARQLLARTEPPSQASWPSLSPLARWQLASARTYQALQQLDRAGQLQVAESSQPLLSILFRCLHMHNNRMGIVLAEEAYIFFLVRQVIHELADLSLPEDEASPTEGDPYGTMV